MRYQIGKGKTGMYQPSDRNQAHSSRFFTQYQSQDGSIDLLQALCNEALNAIEYNAESYIDVNPVVCELFGLS